MLASKVHTAAYIPHPSLQQHNSNYFKVANPKQSKSELFYSSSSASLYCRNAIRVVFKKASSSQEILWRWPIRASF